ncbi:hypothetical protein ABPG72_020558 [Tetrahymena utriculariae]
MKIALILISIISLVSFLTLTSYKQNENLRSADLYCFKSLLNFGSLEIAVTNQCQQNVTFKFSVSASDSSETQKYDLETKCLKKEETQTFKLDFPSNLNIFAQSGAEESEC